MPSIAITVITKLRLSPDRVDSDLCDPLSEILMEVGIGHVSGNGTDTENGRIDFSVHLDDHRNLADCVSILRKLSLPRSTLLSISTSSYQYYTPLRFNPILNLWCAFKGKRHFVSLKPGDTVSIRAGTGTYQGRVLAHFTDLPSYIALAVYDRQQLIETHVTPSEKPSATWTIIGNTPVTDEEANLLAHMSLDSLVGQPIHLDKFIEAKLSKRSD